MIVETHATGLSARRLEYITEHLDRNYVSKGKIAGCQTLVARHGHVAENFAKDGHVMIRPRPHSRTAAVAAE